jgi:hypothetical protein
MLALTIKIPDPIILPATIMVASKAPRVGLKPLFSEFDIMDYIIYRNSKIKKIPLLYGILNTIFLQYRLH